MIALAESVFRATTIIQPDGNLDGSSFLARVPCLVTICMVRGVARGHKYPPVQRKPSEGPKGVLRGPHSPRAKVDIGCCERGGAVGYRGPDLAEGPPRIKFAITIQCRPLQY